MNKSFSFPKESKCLVWQDLVKINQSDQEQQTSEKQEHIPAPSPSGNTTQPKKVLNRQSCGIRKKNQPPQQPSGIREAQDKTGLNVGE